MNIAIIGAGNVGGTLGKRFAAAGHEIVFGVRDPARDKYQSLVMQAGSRARLAGNAEAAAGASAIVLATPWSTTESALAACGDLSGKIVIDATNPLGADLNLGMGLTDSGGEQVARWARGALVVKAFNSTGFNVMDDPVLDGRHAVMFVAGDDAAAKGVVLDLAGAIGFEAIDAGPLKIARLLEPLAVLWIHCAYRQGLTRDYAFALIRRGA
ncbi:MAG: NAD(P)-binding domain-containing protein [Burkholderiales bacterium]|nr:NAD(P)-binding domain-containing protein [Burkholderiales bacterium]